VAAFDVSPFATWAVAQHHNALQSFWQRRRIKGLHVLLELNAEKGILQFKQKTSPLTLIRMTKDEKGLAFFKGLLL
jgi:hypothetical protein